MVNNFLCSLSTELLINIFQYLDIHDILNLRQTCKRFNQIINSWDNVLLQNNLDTLVTNQIDKRMLRRCSKKISAIEKWRIQRNWHVGRYKEKTLLYERSKYIPWLHLDKNFIWLSRGKYIFNYERIKNSIKTGKPIFQLSGGSRTDVVRFAYKNNYLVSGQRDGSMWLWSKLDKKIIFDMPRCHESDISCVDMSYTGDIIISGSRDSSFKIWKKGDTSLVEIFQERLSDRVWSVSMLDDASLVAVGTSGNINLSAIQVYDIERTAAILNLPSENFGSGILDMKWDNCNSLWSCGYEACTRRWDVRTGKCVQAFPDPYGSVLYCLECDYYNTIITGCQMHGRAVLWDVRQPTSVQVYFMASCSKAGFGKSSPIYSLSFDADCLFAATDRHLNILDFSTLDGESKDYRFSL